MEENQKTSNKKEMNKNYGKYAIVFWRDAHYQDGWQEQSEAEEFAENAFNSLNRTYGEIIYENNEYILLSASFTNFKEYIADLMMIPKSMVIKIVRKKIAFPKNKKVNK